MDYVVSVHGAARPRKIHGTSDRMGAGSWLCLPMAELQYRQPAAGAAADVIATRQFLTRQKPIYRILIQA